MRVKRKETRLKLSPELISEIERLIDERVKTVYLTREDFNELKEIVKEMGDSILKLAEAQRKTEERLEAFERATAENFNKVWAAIDQLAEAQRKTEERLNRLAERVDQLAERVDQLAEAQRKTEERLEAFERATAENFNKVWDAINKLTERVDQLAEAQRKTEERLEAFERATAENFNKVWDAINKLTERVDQLAEAQRRTEERLNRLTERVDQLAEAQRKTEERLNQLIIEHQRTREILAGLSDTVGYGLEDKVMLYMREFVKDEYGIEADVIERKNLIYPDGRYDEINIYVEGRKNGERVYVIGECKSRPSKREIDKLVEKRERLRDYFKSDVHAFIVGYSFSPEVEIYLREEHPDVKMFKSYEFEIRYGRKV